MRTYVMQVATGRERQTVQLLERVLGGAPRAELFVPRYRYLKKIKGAWQFTEELLTPGYVYLRTSMLDIDELAQQVRQAPAFARVLAQDGKIIPLSADEERWLQALSGAGESHVVEPSYGFIEGDQVVITEGPLVGFEAQIKKLDRHKRLAYVEVHLMGRTKLIKVGAEIVRKQQR